MTGSGFAPYRSTSTLRGPDRCTRAISVSRWTPGRSCSTGGWRWSRSGRASSSPYDCIARRVRPSGRLNRADRSIATCGRSRRDAIRRRPSAFGPPSTGSTQIEVELNRLGERLAYVTSLHEQAYLLRIHVYNAARTTARTATAGSQAAPALVLPPDPETAQPHLFTYAIAA